MPNDEVYAEIQTAVNVGEPVVLATVASTAAPPPNLAPDTKFRDGDIAALDPPNWRWDPIRSPSEARVDKAKGLVTLVGGRTFLCSGHFGVKAETFYKIGLTARGRVRS